ncbi:MAG: CheR family methyltransferase, partial [Acidobacteriota bacterium]
KYDDMPRAAVASRCVDFVLPPEGIAGELARIGRHPYVAQTEPEAAGPEPEKRAAQPPLEPLAKVLAAVRSATGVDFSLYRQTTVRRRIARRMALHKIEEIEEYSRFLSQNPAEVEALYREILIKVTGFFRDPEMFQVLKSQILPEIFSQLSPEAPIRIWVPGCATGEEAYSITIVLLEFLDENRQHRPVQIFATDVSDEAIEKARAGVYIENIAADVSQERLRRFFVKHDGGYQVAKTVRDLCVFARQNLTKDPPFSKIDLISCRNVLIYLEPVLQKRVIPMFHYALKPAGFLVLENSETVGAFPDLFSLEECKHKIYRKRPVVVQTPFEFDAARAPALKPEGPERAARPGEEAAGGLDLQKEADRIVLARHSPPGVVVNEDLEVVQFRGRTSPYLEPVPGRASLNLLKMAREGLLLELRSALDRAKRSGQPVKKSGVVVKSDGGVREVNFEVAPLHSMKQGRHYLVVFEEARLAPTAEQQKQRKAGESRQVARLKQELVATRAYLQSIIEEHEATNEDL